MKETFHFQSFATSTFTQILFLGRRVITSKKAHLESSIFFNILHKLLHLMLFLLYFSISKSNLFQKKE